MPDMLPTPSTFHIPLDTVYDPSEDSFLLLDTLSSPAECSFLQTRFPQSSPSPHVVEVGTGSGVVLAFILTNASTILHRTDSTAIGIDINPNACKATRETVALAGKEHGPREGTAKLLSTIQADLLSSLREQSVDMLVFNPPYVPTSSLPLVSEREDVDQGAFWSMVATEGGELGMEVTKRFLDGVRRVLSERGVFYLLLSVRNLPDEVRGSIEQWGHGWRAEKVGSTGKTAGFEKLVVVRGWKEGHALP